jgi:hypothetical protein
LAASSVPKSKGTIIGKRSEQAEEDPPARRLRTAKKEEEPSANRSKNIQRKKIHFQTGNFAPIPFRRWQLDQRSWPQPLKPAKSAVKYNPTQPKDWQRNGKATLRFWGHDAENWPG